MKLGWYVEGVGWSAGCSEVLVQREAEDRCSVSLFYFLHLFLSFCFIDKTF